ncbi:MAG: peptidylprolyl isomerase [Spirochaetaceae bacterium]|nr:MAG: peptidylprolyl isomerase [Spirochaetaceae bacterium]
MNVREKTVVSIDYTLKDDSGTVLDSSENREPLSFLYGSGSIIPGLEKALHGRTAGDALSVTVEPDEGYGEYNEDLVFAVGKDRFQDPSIIEVGSQVQAQTADGAVQVLTIKGIGDDDVTLDANHPLAGQTLHFDVAVADVREATAEEVDHGHAHSGADEH